MNTTNDTATVLQEIGQLASLEKTSILDDYADNVQDLDRRENAQNVLELAPNVAGVMAKDAPKFLDDVSEILYFSKRQRVAKQFGLRFPIYDVTGSYEYNAALPWFTGPAKRSQKQVPRWSLFGKEIGFPIGVPASALTGSASQVAALAQSGYNVITFKTVRSRAHAASEAPNWVMLSDAREPLPIRQDRDDVVVHGSPEAWVGPNTANVSTANSFGVPSLDPSDWSAEVDVAQQSMAEDQVLLVSVMGEDYLKTGSRAALVADWVEVTMAAVKAGARHVELNLSCPNTLSASSPDGVHPPLCEDVDLSIKIVSTVRKAIDPNIDLVAKLSYLDGGALENLVSGIAVHVAAISGINTLPLKVLNDAGAPTFGTRVRAGVSGVAIRNYALDFVKNLNRIRVEGRYSYEIIGMGGVTDAQSFVALYEAGASVVQSASGVFHDVDFGQQCTRELSAILRPVPPIAEELRSSYELAVKSVLTKRPSGKFEVAVRLPFPVSQTFDILTQLARKKDGVVKMERRKGHERYSLNN